MPPPKAAPPWPGPPDSWRAGPSTAPRGRAWSCSIPGPGGSTGRNPLIFRRFPRMRIAILDPAAGISGDMTLGALLSLGVPEPWLQSLPARLGLAGVGVTVRDAVRCGVGCKQVEFTIPERPHGRHVGGLVRLVQGAPISDWAKEGAVRAVPRGGEGERRGAGRAA